MAGMVDRRWVASIPAAEEIWPGIATTVKLDLIKSNYWSLSNVNPGGIVPLGLIVDLTGPHGRNHLRGRGISERD